MSITRTRQTRSKRRSRPCGRTSKASSSLCLVLVVTGIVRLYDLIVAQTGGGPGISTEVPAKYVYDMMFQAANLGQGFAASTMMLVTVAIVVIPWAILEFGGKQRG